MIDSKKIRDDVAEYKKMCTERYRNIDVDTFIALDDQRKQLQHDIDTLKNQQKQLASEQKYDEAKALKEKIQSIEITYDDIKQQYDKLYLTMPNLVHPDVPVGKDDMCNVEVKKYGTLPKFDFEPLDHMTLMKKYDMIDVERGVKLAGARSYFLKNDGMLLEQAVLQYALHKMVQKGFVPMAVPNMVDPKTLTGTGYFPGGEDDAYHLEKDDKWLIATAEIPLTAYHMDEVLEESELPKRYVGLSPCYRREAGSYGKDTAGLYRVHQFSKVEQVVILPQSVAQSDKWHITILENAMEILDDLQLPYRLLQLCTGDMAIGKYNSHDLECWMPSRNGYGETHSVSSFLDFQARRLNLRYRAEDGTIKHCYTLNNTVIATPRFLIALIENYQQIDGTIKIPDVLVPYMGKSYIGKNT